MRRRRLAPALVAALALAPASLALARGGTGPGSRHHSQPGDDPAHARLTGTFRMSGRVYDAQNVYGEYPGQTLRRTWRFIPWCSRGPCGRIDLVRQRQGGSDRLTLYWKASAYYVGYGAFYAPLQCGGRYYAQGEYVPFQIIVQVTDARIDTSGIIAHGIHAQYSNSYRVNQTPCVRPPSHDGATYVGYFAHK